MKLHICWFAWRKGNEFSALTILGQKCATVMLTLALIDLSINQAEKGGMVPLKGNLRNLAEKSILGC